MIFTLVEFLSFSKQKYISKTDLGQAINELIEENGISDEMKAELLKMLKEDTEALVSIENKYFDKLKNYILRYAGKVSFK